MRSNSGACGRRAGDDPTNKVDRVPYTANVRGRSSFITDTEAPPKPVPKHRYQSTGTKVPVLKYRFFIRDPMRLIERTRYTDAGAVEDVGVDHRGGDVGVAEQLLNGADIVIRLE